MSFLTDSLGYILPFLVVLTVLVFVHEMGHYLVARYNGVRVDAFSIGFGPELFGWTAKSGTRWKICMLPIGGYVMMFGDADPSSKPSEAIEAMDPAERAMSLHHKTVGQRAAISVAGPAANFLFALILLSGLFMTAGQQITPPDVGAVVAGGAADAAGIKPGDIITSIDGQTVNRFEEIKEIVQLNLGTELSVRLRRDGQDMTVLVTPKVTDMVDHFGMHHPQGLLGISREGVSYVRLSPVAAVWQAGGEVWSMSTGTLKALGQMIIGARPADELGGPLRIAQISGVVWQGGALSLLSLMVALSVNLGLINLFPIPVLDGGHLLFYAAEAVRGRPLGVRAQEVGFRIGLALVLSLMVFATWNDLVQMKVFALLRGLIT